MAIVSATTPLLQRNVVVGPEAGRQRPTAAGTQLTTRWTSAAVAEPRPAAPPQSALGAPPLAVTAARAPAVTHAGAQLVTAAVVQKATGAAACREVGVTAPTVTHVVVALATAEVDPEALPLPGTMVVVRGVERAPPAATGVRAGPGLGETPDRRSVSTAAGQMGAAQIVVRGQIVSSARRGR
jgi:hypothetical protein